MSHAVIQNTISDEKKKKKTSNKFRMVSTHACIEIKNANDTHPFAKYV